MGAAVPTSSIHIKKSTHRYTYCMQIYKCTHYKVNKDQDEKDILMMQRRKGNTTTTTNSHTHTHTAIDKGF